MPTYAHLTLHTDLDDELFLAEVRATTEGLKRGMMHREKWEPINAMLFVFPHTTKRAMWMRNTPLPLDILFFDEEQFVIGIARHTVPFSDTPIPCPGNLPFRFALEIPAGVSLDREIDIGDRLVRSQSRRVDVEP